jgi:L-xylulokinase
MVRPDAGRAGGAPRRSVRACERLRRGGRGRPTIRCSTPSSTAATAARISAAAFYGLAGWHDEGHILRALFEGVCFEHRRHVEVLASAGARIDGRAVGRRRALGGLAADDGRLPGLPVALGREEDRRAGCRHGGAVGVGLYADDAACAAAMTRPARGFVPEAGRTALHDRRYAVWNGSTAAMEPFWAELAGLGEA